MRGSRVYAAAVLHEGEKMIPAEITGRPKPGRTGIGSPVDAMEWGAEHRANLFLVGGTMEGMAKKRINIERPTSTPPKADKY